MKKLVPKENKRSPWFSVYFGMHLFLTIWINPESILTTLGFGMAIWLVFGLQFNKYKTMNVSLASTLYFETRRNGHIEMENDLQVFYHSLNYCWKVPSSHHGNNVMMPLAVVFGYSSAGRAAKQRGDSWKSSLLCLQHFLWPF